MESRIEEKTPPTNIVHQALTQTQGVKLTSVPLIAAAVFIIILGMVSGYLLSQRGAVKGSKVVNGSVSSEKLGKGTVVGSSDTKTFRDSTEGTLERGGIDGEGSHHLVRPGGISQTVYLTSSIIDLEQFVGQKVKVWGETNKARKAGWLMDVGKVEILE
ncbi:hypothetical protein HYW66_01290 [Candidatus Microgenomates bacterium]|nr:hypothetical protein [Candidatus Microgenomates bacterium]